MTMLTQLCMDHEGKPNVLRTIAKIAWIVVLVLAIFLAVKDMNLLSHLSTKIWILALAILIPELYVILHGISSSSMGVSFFTGSPIESRMKSWGSHDMGGDSMMMPKAGPSMDGLKSKMSQMAADMPSSTPSDSSSLF